VSSNKRFGEFALGLLIATVFMAISWKVLAVFAFAVITFQLDSLIGKE